LGAVAQKRRQDENPVLVPSEAVPSAKARPRPATSRSSGSPTSSTTRFGRVPATIWRRPGTRASCISGSGPTRGSRSGPSTWSGLPPGIGLASTARGRAAVEALAGGIHVRRQLERS